MNFEKPSFESVTATGKSLVFVLWRSGALSLSNSFIGRPGLTGLHDSPMRDFELTLKLWSDTQAGALVLLPQQFAHGFRVQADRVIWVGVRPHRWRDPYAALYMQSMSRANMPWGQPAKWHYSEEEVFPTTVED